MKIYLDNCCFNRPYDDLSSETVRLEAEAKILIQSLLLNNAIELVWSFILSIENDENPNEDIKNEISEWKKRATIYIPPSDSTEMLAQKIFNIGIKQKDAVHISCAIEAKSMYFITTDRKLINKARNNINEIEIINPIDFIAILEGKHEK